MKRSKKNLLGALGLTVVAATTIYAATLPAPEAQATSITDTIQVRVVTDDPQISISTDLADQVIRPDYTVTVSYANVETVALLVTRLDAAGNVVSGPTEVWTKNANYDEGEDTLDLDLDYLGGYGEYIFTSTGKDIHGVTHEKSLRVNYTNVDADVNVSDDGSVCVDISNPNRVVAKVGVRVYDAENNLVGEDTVVDPNGQLTLPIDEAPAGTYTVRLTYYASNDDVIGTETTFATKSAENEQIIISVKTETGGVAKALIYLYKDGVLKEVIEAGPDAGCVNLPVDKYGPGGYTVVVEYKDEDDDTVGQPAEFEFFAPEPPSAGTPDTGSFFHNLDISRADYIATGLIVFFVFAVVALGVITRNRKTTTKHSKKRR